MLTLYFAPGACSILPHVALRAAKVPFQLKKVDFRKGKQLPDGSNLANVNPKSYVPALVLENGELLTEASVIAQYVADLAPESKLAPAAGTFERVRLQEWLNFIATELHKGIGPLFSPAANDEFKKAAGEKFVSRLEHVAKALEGKKFLMGDTFTLADAYVFYALRAWNVFFKNEIPAALSDYYERVSAVPAVQEAVAAEQAA
jgi:glutathione S-transferase